MVIDSSALFAILAAEPEAESFIAAIEKDSRRLISAPTLVEIGVVVASRFGELGLRELDLFVYKAGLVTVAFDSDQAELARQAYLKFGKGRHPAGLNLGDCFSYALAKQSGERLLYKGNDFSRTDLAV